MAQYDATSPHQGNERTMRAKQRMTQVITEQMSARGYKVTVKEEVSAVIENKKYHADLAVLFRSRNEFDFYAFFIVEIDGVIGHETFRHDIKERIRDESFLKRFGIATVRIPLVKVNGRDSIGNDIELFDSFVWPVLVDSYIDPSGEKNIILSEQNRKFAILLKENSSTQCSQCSHKAYQHNLAGCEWQNSNKAKLKCFCKNPYYVSDL